MAIEAFGLATTARGAATESIRVTAADAPADVYLRWHTLYATGVITHFDLAISVRRVKKGGGGVSEPQYGDWSDWYYERVAIASCNPQQDDAGYNYCHTLNLAGMYSKEGLSGGFAFESRANDEMDIQLKVKAVYDTTWANTWNGGVTVSEVTYSEAWIGWIPTYSVSAASFNSTHNLQLTFSRPNWARTDDIVSITSVVQNGVQIKGSKKTEAAVKNGVVTIPARLLTRNVQAGSVTVNGTVYASYKDRDHALTTFSSTVTVADLSVSSTPSISLARSGTRLKVTIADTGDTSVKSTSWRVKLRGGDDETDTVEGADKTVYIPFPPYDKALTVECRGLASNAQSRLVTASITIPSSNDGTTITSVDDASLEAVLYYGATSKRQANREANVVKLAGRSRESAYFGQGAEVSETILAKIIEVEGVELGMTETLERLATEATAVMVRRPGGYRSRCALTKCSVQRGCVSPVRDVQVTLVEVD